MQIDHHNQSAAFKIPGSLNIVLLITSTIFAICLLYLVSHASNFYIKIIAVILFSLIANTLFSLLHEAVHGIFHRNRLINLWAGRFSACWFPTSFSIQKNFHLTHHVNNRNEFEQFDVIHDGDMLWLKYAQWYSILTGFYWLVSQLNLLIYLLVPNSIIKKIGQKMGQQSQMQTGGDVYLQALLQSPERLSRVEILAAYFFQFSICFLFDISLSAWLVCYCAFAFQWSSLQYTDHAFSPLDQKLGAWNLKINPCIGIWFLNYHYHLAHHQNPNVPWLYLPLHVDQSQPRPSFFKVWWYALRGPRKISDFPNL